eukprot:TRINITY_DN1165_c0_g1_i3.p2 TRINITY_DN1165_c0_g1~~TRINITY_DN1165_c0_g1_i3.p2  ORF type:complete len:162 (-),score=13.95 TRINITY_DN1165_c0_g1_i3:283-768(-)
MLSITRVRDLQPSFVVRVYIIQQVAVLCVTVECARLSSLREQCTSAWECEGCCWSISPFGYEENGPQRDQKQNGSSCGCSKCTNQQRGQAEGTLREFCSSFIGEQWRRKRKKQHAIRQVWKRTMSKGCCYRVTQPQYAPQDATYAAKQCNKTFWLCCNASF